MAQVFERTGSAQVLNENIHRNDLMDVHSISLASKVARDSPRDVLLKRYQITTEDSPLPVRIASRYNGRSRYVGFRAPRDSPFRWTYVTRTC